MAQFYVTNAMAKCQQKLLRRHFVFTIFSKPLLFYTAGPGPVCCSVHLVKIKFYKSPGHCLILNPHLLISCQYIGLLPRILAAEAIILILFLIIKHIDIQIPHETGGTPVI